jgi:hypothetical protein
MVYDMYSRVSSLFVCGVEDTGIISMRSGTTVPVLARPQQAGAYMASWNCLVPEGKNLARASRLTTWTAKSPASIIVQPSFARRFEFGGSVTGGED